MKPLLVIGLGNTLMRDEGIGLYLLEALRGRAEQYPEVEFLDLGVAGLALLHHLPGRRKAILLDCAYMNAEPGTLRRFTPDDVVSVKTLAGFSLHEGDLLQILELARKLNTAPEEIVIFGIQPGRRERGGGAVRDGAGEAGGICGGGGEGTRGSLVGAGLRATALGRLVPPCPRLKASKGRLDEKKQAF